MSTRHAGKATAAERRAWGPLRGSRTSNRQQQQQHQQEEEQEEEEEADFPAGASGAAATNT
ncbi:hypothetical protein ACSSS7_004524 [Eimeria intestinalis]